MSHALDLLLKSVDNIPYEMRAFLRIVYDNLEDMDVLDRYRVVAEFFISKFIVQVAFVGVHHERMS